jgi:ABC-type polysaccharide/polyol phosphate transport system ATPase subunit
MDKQIAISVNNVSKTFRIPHEKVSSLRGAFTSSFSSFHLPLSKGTSPTKSFWRGQGGVVSHAAYEEFKALDEVSFEVKKGEFFGIIGRNGSGKSTLLKVLAGIYQPDKVHHVGSKNTTVGKVHVNGLISPFLELGIGFNPELSGRDNVYLNATVLGLTKKQIDAKFDDIVRFSELERFIDQKLKNYSSGMQVRLAFSVSIHANRDILLMDEVLAVGDSNFQSKCLEEFAKYRDLGRTVILVTHDIAVVQRYCDRAMLLRSGKIEMIGDPQKVGSEYIEQNMSDEERRIRNEEKFRRQEEELKQKHLSKQQQSEAEQKRRQEEKELEEREKSRVAKITKVEFRDKDGEVKNVFRTGDDMSIRVYFNVRDADKILNLGLAIHSQDAQYIFGINTFMDEVNKEKYIRLGYFQINLFNLPLKNNTYYIKAAIHGDNAVTFYDLLEKSDEFKFVSKRKSHGFTEIDYKWS